MSSPRVFHISFGRSLTDDPPPDVSIILFVVASFVTIYRCSARYAKRLWGHDDSAALFSLLSFIFFVIGSYDVYHFVRQRADDFS